MAPLFALVCFLFVKTASGFSAELPDPTTPPPPTDEELVKQLIQRFYPALGASDLEEIICQYADDFPGVTVWNMTTNSYQLYDTFSYYTEVFYGCFAREGFNVPLPFSFRTLNYTANSFMITSAFPIGSPCQFIEMAEVKIVDGVARMSNLNAVFAETLSQEVVWQGQGTFIPEDYVFAPPADTDSERRILTQELIQKFYPALGNTDIPAIEALYADDFAGITVWNMTTNSYKVYDTYTYYTEVFFGCFAREGFQVPLPFSFRTLNYTDTTFLIASAFPVGSPCQFVEYATTKVVDGEAKMSSLDAIFSETLSTEVVWQGRGTFIPESYICEKGVLDEDNPCYQGPPVPCGGSEE